MKEIFDWLREQMEWNQIIEMHFDGTPPKQYVERERWVDVINEAEDNWKDVCKRADFEHRINEVLPMLEEKQLYGTASLIKDLAYVLGIKIAEVE